MDNKRVFNFVAISLIVLLGFGAYINSIYGEFIWDDDNLVKDNIYIRNRSYIPNIFTEDVTAGAGRKYNYYRPLLIFTYLIDYSVWGLDVKGYHLTNIIFHILVAATLFWLLSLLYNDRILSLLTSILFIAHPIHTEAIASIAGRMDAMSTLFILLSLVFYLKSINVKNSYFYIIALLSYIFALLSKENSLILPALLLLYHFSFRKKIKIDIFIPFLALPIIYLILRSIFLKTNYLDTMSLSGILQRVPGFFEAIINYVRLLILPFSLHLEYGSKLFNFYNPKVIFGIIVSFLLLAYALKRRDKNRLISFSILWFFIALIPVSNLYPVGFYMAEHYLYLPSIGFFLIFASGLNYLYKIKNFRFFALIAITSLSIFYSYLTIRQNEYWKEPLAFYERTLKYAPHTPRLLTAYGNAYAAMGKYWKAEPLYRKAIAINPKYIYAYCNLGSAFAIYGRNKEAIKLFTTAIEIDPGFVLAHNNLASAYYFNGQHDLAIKHCDIALDLGYNVTPELIEFLKPHREKQ